MQARKSTCRVICWGFPIDLSSFAMHFLFYSYSSLRINRSPPSSPFLSSKGEPSNFKCTRERNGNRAIPQTQTLPPSPPPWNFKRILFRHFGCTLDLVQSVPRWTTLDERNSTEEGGRGVPLPLRSPPSEKSSKVQHLDRFLQSILVDEDREREEEREERKRGEEAREERCH